MGLLSYGTNARAFFSASDESSGCGLWNPTPAKKGDGLATWKETNGALDRFVRRQLKLTGTPGAAVGIQLRGRSYANGFGVTNVDNPLPVNTDTLFQIGSTTKTFTATAIMRLVERGKVALDAPVRRYLPEFRLR